MSRPYTFLEQANIRPIAPRQALSLMVETGHASWRQYPAYSEVAAEQVGADQEYWGLYAHNEIIAIANIRTKRLPLLGWGIAMIAQGPVILPAAHGKYDVKALYQVFASQLSQKLSASVRINQPVSLPAQAFDTGKASADAAIKHLKNSEYETFIIDLAPDLDALRAGLNGKWRTDLRRGERGNVNIIRSSAPDAFRKFQPLLQALAGQKGFTAPQDANFFAQVAQKIEEHKIGDERLVVHLAYNEDRLIGGHIGAFSGDMAVYLLGATNDEGRDMRASFLLQWAVIEYAKSMGMRYYDLGGVDEADNPSVYRFKKRMGGVYYVGPAMMEYRAAWPKGIIIAMAERLYQKVRG